MTPNVVASIGINCLKTSSATGYSGAVYFDATQNRMKIIDSYGNATPVNIDTYSIGLDAPTLEVVVWARNKMDQEKKLSDLCDKYPALKDIKEKYEMMLILCTNEGQ